MKPLSYARHQFPPDIIRHAVWLYLRFTLSFGDVEDLLAERGIEVSYETVRRWVLKFGPAFARELRRSRPRPSSQWHLDEMSVAIGGERVWLWRAVDHEGEVLDLLVQFPLHACRNLQHLHRSPSPHDRSRSPALPCRRLRNLARGRRRSGLRTPMAHPRV